MLEVIALFSWIAAEEGSALESCQVPTVPHIEHAPMACGSTPTFRQIEQGPNLIQEPTHLSQELGPSKAICVEGAGA